MTTNQQKKASVGAKELTALLVIIVTTHAFLTYPQSAISTAYESAWMEPIITGGCTLILFLIVEKLLSRYFPNMDIVQVCKETFGRYIAMGFAIIFALYFICVTAAVVREFTENVITSVLPNTPILVIGSVFMLAVSYIAYKGLEGICRVSYLALPVLIIGTLGLCVLTINWWEPSWLLPFWGRGWHSVLSGSLRYSSIFTNVLILCIIYPHAHDPKSFRKIGVWSLLISTSLMVFFILAYSMVIPVTETGKSSFALYQLARMIDLGRFLQRFESVFIFLWVTTATVKMSATIWASAYLLSKAFDWPTYKPGVPALGLLCFSLSLSVENVVEVRKLYDEFIMSWGSIVTFGLPVLIVMSGVIRHHLRNGPNDGDRRRRRNDRVKDEKGKSQRRRREPGHV